jgi:glycolate oxidase iron-sulfur subunit
MPQPFHISQPTEDQYLNCIRCGLCLAVCPTYREDLSEISSPRGRVALARKGLEGDLDIRSNLIDQMYACLDCLACDEICPVGIRPAELAMDMRALQEQTHPAAWKRPLFEGIFPKPRRLELATWPLRLYERLGIRRLVQRLRLGWLLPGRLREMEVMLPTLPRQPLRRVLPEISAADGKSHRRVGFFLGCLQSLMFEEESAASVRVLTRNGCTVISPKETVCCGMPALAFGKTEQVQQQARHNIALFEKAEVEFIVTDCATCGSTLKDYGHLLANDPTWCERAATFSKQVRDISEFLMSIPLEKPQGRIEARVTYHDPCHLRRAQGVWKEPRALLKLIDGLEFVELPEADWCCGLAGTQLVTHHETSLKVLKRKTDNLTITQAGYVASGCPACQMQLTLGVQRAGLDMRVVHPIQLLDRAYSQTSTSTPSEDGADSVTHQKAYFTFIKPGKGQMKGNRRGRNG